MVLAVCGIAVGFVRFIRFNSWKMAQIKSRISLEQLFTVSDALTLVGSYRSRDVFQFLCANCRCVCACVFVSVCFFWVDVLLVSGVYHISAQIDAQNRQKFSSLPMCGTWCVISSNERIVVFTYVCVRYTTICKVCIRGDKATYWNKPLQQTIW